MIQTIIHFCRKHEILYTDGGTNRSTGDNIQGVIVQVPGTDKYSM